MKEEHGPQNTDAEPVDKYTYAPADELSRLKQLFQQAPGFMCALKGPDYIFEIANDAYYQLVGHRDVLGMSLVDALPELIEQGYLEKLDRVFATGEPFIGRALPILLQREPQAALEPRYIDLVYQPIRAENGDITGIFVQGHDVTEAHNLAREVAYQASHDPLTGLRNRRALERYSRDIETQPGHHVLFYLDIDHFKVINDRGGHAGGDALLTQIAAILRQLVEPGHMLARFGGDEFVIILRDCGMTQAIELANKMLSAVRNLPFCWEGQRYSVTLSLGLAQFGATESMSFDEALSLADVACFLAKEKGRNRYHIGHLSDSDIAQRHHDMGIAEFIKDGLRNDRVVVHAQQIVAIQSDAENAIEAMELLVRMEEADGTLVSPGAFIPAAERFGLMEQLDFRVIELGFQSLHKLSRQTRKRTRYFINVSGMTLCAPGFAAHVSQLLRKYHNVQPDQVCFEITETAAISALHEAGEAIRQLRSQGFYFALDDFGSGMSSFCYLRELPVQYLKVAGALVNGITTGPVGIAVLDAIARVAKAMELRIIAESIEDATLIPPLREMGIDFVQGFALHRPEPLADMLRTAPGGVRDRYGSRARASRANLSAGPVPFH